MRLDWRQQLVRDAAMSHIRVRRSDERGHLPGLFARFRWSEP
jgi:hypothetical protein